MTGAQSLLQTLVNGGVEMCFTNPGTSEMYFIAAVDRVRGMRTVLGLFEGVCTGAADGYARMAGKPAATLLHLGPGLGNGLANLHNARRANSPMINIVGDHTTYHLRHDPPLTTDIESIVRGFSGWVRRSRSAADVPADAADALVAAMTPPGQVATLILPADCSWNESREPAPGPRLPRPVPVEHATIRQIADVLRMREPAVILLSGTLLMEDGLRLAGRISHATGARIMGNRVNARSQRGAGRVVIERLPYPIAPALEMLQGTAHLILVGSPPPVPFFAWQGKPNWIIPEDVPDACPGEAGGGLSGRHAGAGGRARRRDRFVDRGSGHPAAAPDGRNHGGEGLACARGPHARERDRLRRGGELEPRRRHLDHRRAAARLVERHGRFHRSGVARGHGSGSGLSRPKGVRDGERRGRHVHPPVALDAGARAAGRRDGDLRQPGLQDSPGRVASKWGSQTRGPRRPPCSTSATRTSTG